MYALLNMAISARDLAREAQEHFEIDPADFGFIDHAYWLCADLRDAIERAADALDPEDTADFLTHKAATAWYEIMQATCDDLVTFAGERDHEIRRS